MINFYRAYPALFRRGFFLAHCTSEEAVAGPTLYLQLPLFNRQVLCGMFINYLSSIFICSSNESDEETDSDDAHIQVVYKPEYDILAAYIQELHMYELPSALKSHDMSSTSMLLEKIILLISYILTIKLFV